jgi:hypothetical protein
MDLKIIETLFWKNKKPLRITHNEGENVFVSIQKHWGKSWIGTTPINVLNSV